MKLFYVAVMALSLGGCASTSTNVTKFGDEYYSENIAKSKNIQDLKAYLSKNNLKLGVITSLSNIPTGSLGRLVVDGQNKSLASSKESNVWLRATINSLHQSELYGFTNDLPGYTLFQCGDYTHSSIGENGSYGRMEYTYFLSKMTEDNRQSILKASMLPDCGYSELVGDIIYKKKIQIDSNPNKAKVSIILTDKSKPITNMDNVALILKDMADQAMTAELTDGDLLIALKDYQLTGGKIPSQPIATAKEPIVQNQAINLDEFKAQCKELGFKVGSLDHGNCVLQLMK